MIRHIVHLVDQDIHFHTLPLVSHLLHSICLNQPRVGNYTLLGGGQDKAFKVQHIGSTLIETFDMKLTRITENKLKEGLAGMFQHHQAGVGAVEAASEGVAKIL
jgi:hypothetical protein